LALRFRTVFCFARAFPVLSGTRNSLVEYELVIRRVDGLAGMVSEESAGD